MITRAPILLFVSDGAVLSSLQFSLAIEGFVVADRAAAACDSSTASALVIDRPVSPTVSPPLPRSGPEDAARRPSFSSPTQLPGRARAAAAGAVLIEKPLVRDELSSAMRAALETQKAA